MEIILFLISNISSALINFFIIGLLCVLQIGISLRFFLSIKENAMLQFASKT